MGLRFRKSIKIAPGLKINLNKNSIGATIGTRGAHYTINSKGKRTASVGIPGTGLSYTSTSGGSNNSSSKHSSNDNKVTTPDNNDNGQKWYQKTAWIVALLILFFPVGLFLMWKYTNWNKYVKIGISAFFAIALLVPSSSSELEKIKLSADTSRSYDRNEKILIEYSTEPSDYSLNSSDFETTGGSINSSDGRIYFSSLFTGTYEIYAESSGIKSNVLIITIEDKETISETENETQEIPEQSEQQTTEQPQNEQTTEEPQQTVVQQDNTTPPAATDNSSASEVEDKTVYITNTGNKYHRGTCRHLKDSKIEKKLSEVINDYAPCGTCKPPTQ